jgi:hypothetical protein
MREPVYRGKYKGHKIEIRQIGHSLTGVPWLGLFLDGVNTDLKGHGESVTKLRYKAKQLINGRNAQ